jgi:polyisoprenoid-binding protein YceI
MVTPRVAAAALLVCMSPVAAILSAQETARVAVSPESKLWIEGTSNLHGWRCTAEKLEADIDLDATVAAQPATAAPKALKRAQVRIPVKSLKCGHGAMDNNLYKALNAEAAPDISYILATFETAPGEVKDEFTLRTVGTLSVAGKENRITMDIEATRMPDGSVKAKGMVPVRMTDFGITPPTAIFGRLKTGDEVKVNFELAVSAKAIAMALGGQR